MTVDGIACCPLRLHSEMNHLNPANHIACCFIALKADGKDSPKECNHGLWPGVLLS